MIVLPAAAPAAQVTFHQTRAPFLECQLPSSEFIFSARKARPKARRGDRPCDHIAAGLGMAHEGLDRMKAALLPDRGVVKIAGDGARNFLHGLVTADIVKLVPTTARFTALLT